MKYIGFFFICLFTINLSAQDLMAERIRKVSSRKKSIFLNRGIFHNGGKKVKSRLKAVRHSYRKSLGYERIVFDFETNEVPRMYGHISGAENRLYVDFFDSTIVEKMNSFGNSKFVESLNFFPITPDSLSVEIKFKSNVSVDLFYLSSPGRFVIDVK